MSEDTEYTYWVKAFSGDLESNASNTTTVRTSVCPPADTEPPVVNWVAPASNTQTYHVRNETIRLEVEATDNVGVTRVRFYRWDAVNEVYVNIGYDDMPPYQFDLDCTILNYEWNQIFVQAFDAVGHVSERKWIFLFRDRPQPDLVPSQWQDWQYPIVPASITGTNVVNTLYAGYPTFIDWGISNLGDANSGGASYGDLYIDNVRKTHYDFGDILSGQLWAFFDWQEVISTPGWHTLKVVADPDNLVAEFDETNNVWEHSFYWVPSAPYHDDMENGANSWTAAGLWHRIQVTSPYRESHSGSRSWWYGQEATGDYDTGSDHAGGLTSPLVYIPSAGYYMRFWYWYETETYGPDWDQRWVQISVDGGPFNDVLQLANDPQGGWFESAALDLSGYAGQAIQIRFRFDSLDASLNDYRGWYIDDLNITTAPPPNCADSHEPNNVASQAATIAYGQTLEADICPKSDWDFYAFDGKAGDQVVIDIDAQINGSPLDPYVFLLDSDGESILAENDDEILGEVRDSRLAYHLNQDGTYYVKVRAWNHPSVGDPNHLYTIRLVTDNQSPPQASIQTPQSGAWLDHNLQTLGVSASDHESGIDRVDFFWHSADWENSDWIWLGIDIDGRDGWGLDLDTSAWVEQKGGALYIWAFDWANNWTGTGAWNLGLDRTAPAVTMQAGQYYSDAPFQDFWISWNGTDEPAGVASYDVQYRDGHNGAWIDFQTDTTDDHAPFVGENEHSYFFRARARDHAGNQGVYMSGDGDVQHTVQICDTPPDAYEPDGTVDSAGGLTVDGGSQTHTIHAGEDEDWVKFYAVSGVLYTLATTNTGGHADTVLELYGTDGSTLIASNDDDPTRWPASRLDWLPSATGMYYARVYHWDQWAYGCTTEYGLSIQTDDQTPPAGSVRINSGDMYAESRSVTLHLGGTDEGTGVGSLMASNYTDFPDAVWIAYSPTLNWTLTEGVGNKTVYVKYRDRAGNVSSVISDDIIYYELVTANFSADVTHGSAPLAVHFQDRSSGPVAAWGWSFGDGQTSTLQNPTHTYARDGSYEVTLTVRLAGQAADYPRGTDTLSRKDYIVTSFRMYLPLVLWYR